nr:uncharacterized mitochondrial protein AtMg00810-like [Tanacetum cinerariifolium]
MPCAFYSQQTLEQTFNRLQAIIDDDDIEEMDIKWNLSLLSMRADRFWKKIGKKITIQGSDITKESRQKEERESYKKDPKVEEPAPKAMIAIYDKEEVPTEYALMANSSSSSDNEVKKEKESTDFKIENFENALKDLDRLLESQKLDKDKKGVGFIEYCDVPPPPAQVYLPPKKDLSWMGLPEFVDDIDNTDDKGYWDSGCSRHMTRNISYFSEYEPFNRGYVSFGNEREKITGKDFKLVDDKHVLLRTPRQKNMYTINLKNVVPHKNLTCLIANASVDKSMLWHRRESSIRLLDETSRILRNFITEIENLKDLNVKIIRSDNRGEFRNKETDEFCSRKGIKREFSNARTPQQNGVAERRNKTLIKAARTMLADAKLPVTFWAEEVNTACYVQNKEQEEVNRDKEVPESSGNSNLTASTKVSFNDSFELTSSSTVETEVSTVCTPVPTGSLSVPLEEGIDYKEVFVPVARIEAIRLFLAYASYMGFLVYQKDVKSAFLYGTIDEEVNVMQPHGFQDPEFPHRVYKDGIGKDAEVHLYRSMIGSLMYLTTSRPDVMFVVCAYARHQVTPKECHLYVFKRIFRYLKGHLKLGLWYPKESPFDLVAYSDSDYGGANQDRESTTRGCQFLGRRGTIRIFRSKVPSPRADKTAFPTGDVRYREAFPTVTRLDVGQGRENIVKTFAIPHEASPRVTSLGGGEEDAPNTRGMDQGEDLLVGDTVKDNDKSADKGSDSTDEMANVLGTLGAANILASGGLRLVFTTASLSVATAGIVVSPAVATASESFPTAAIFTLLPSKEKVLEQMSAQLARDLEAKFAQEDQIIREQAKRDSEIARIHAERELEMMIIELDRSNEIVVKYLSEYEQAKTGLSHDEKIKEKFIPVWEKMQDFVPMNSKLESERLKRPRIQLGKESFKKLKTAEVSELVPVEEVYIEALQVKYPIIDWEIYSEGLRKYWKIIRVGNHTEVYQIFNDMLKKFDRENLDRLWSLVKETCSIIEEIWLGLILYRTHWTIKGVLRLSVTTAGNYVVVVTRLDIFSTLWIKRWHYNLTLAESKFKTPMLDHQDKHMTKAQGAFLVKIRDNTFNGIIGENMFEHINRFLEVVGPIKINGVSHDRFRLSIFPISLVEIEAKEDDDPDNNADIFKIEGNLFNYETPLCKPFNDFNYLLKINRDLFTFDIQGIRTYEEYELNNTMTRDLEEPSLDNRVPYQLCDHICEPYRFKNGIAKWPTCSSDIDGFSNGGELRGMVQVESMTYFQDHKWYVELSNGKLKEETLMHKTKVKESRGNATPSVMKFYAWRFEMMKYSFNADEEYIAIKESEYLNHLRDNLAAYRELLCVIDEGWVMATHDDK